MVVIEFPSIEKARTWYSDPEYQPLLRFRQTRTRARSTKRWLQAKQKDWTIEEGSWRRRSRLADRRLLAAAGGLRWAPGRGLLTELDAFYTEHRRCGELEAGVEGPTVWIARDCGASMARRVAEDDRD